MFEDTTAILKLKDRGVATFDTKTETGETRTVGDVLGVILKRIDVRLAQFDVTSLREGAVTIALREYQ